MDMKRNRYQFLKKLYDVTEGNESSCVSMLELGNKLGFSQNETDIIVQYLVEEDLVKYFVMTGGIVITHWGVMQVEEALSNPDKSTQ